MFLTLVSIMLEIGLYFFFHVLAKLFHTSKYQTYFWISHVFLPKCCYEENCFWPQVCSFSIWWRDGTWDLVLLLLWKKKHTYELAVTVCKYLKSPKTLTCWYKTQLLVFSSIFLVEKQKQKQLLEVICIK